MELVYLWIEDCKNIKKQGFNFSPRFECEFKDKYNSDGKLKENCELVITEKDNVSIFPDNINITAIVGENGSGKSSVLEVFNFSLSIKKVYYLYIKNGKLYSNYFQKDKTSRYIIKKPDISSEIIYMNKLFFLEKSSSELFDTLKKDNLYKQAFQAKNNEVSSDYFHKNILELIFKKICLSSDFFTPENIKVDFNLLQKNLLLDYQINYLELFNKDKLHMITNFKTYYKIYLKSLELFESNANKEKVSEELRKFINQDEKEILEYSYSVDDEMLLFLDVNDEKIFLFLKKIFDKKNELIKIESFGSDYLHIDTENLVYNVFYYLYKIGFLEYEIYDKIGKSFSSLSSGEKTFFTDFCLLTKEFNEIEKVHKESKKPRYIILFLDEPDLTLHPSWQKQYINELISFLNQYKYIKFHLIFTSHSPFLISDLPKENVIFLEKGKQVYPDIETFGANIHTLLSHGFFMKDGLMGEFAKGQINKAITMLNKSKLDEKEIKFCENIISITGEPILKRQMQKMMDSKRLSKIDKIDDLESEIELIKHRIEMIRKNQ